MLKQMKIIIMLAIWSVSAAVAADPVKIGMITTLSTKAGYLGEEIRDGFRLAMDSQGGRLGGIEVQLLVEDDGRKPERGKQIAERYIKRENIKIITGIVFSNVAMAVVPKVVRGDVFYISPNAGRRSWREVAVTKIISMSHGKSSLRHGERPSRVAR